MKLSLLVLLTALCTSAHADACHKATEEATRIHMEYVKGQATLRDSYNATAVMDLVCQLNDEVPEGTKKDSSQVAFNNN